MSQADPTQPTTRHSWVPTTAYCSTCSVCGCRASVFMFYCRDYLKYLTICPGPKAPEGAIAQEVQAAHCECGIDRIGGGIHSDWCPKH